MAGRPRRMEPRRAGRLPVRARRPSQRSPVQPRRPETMHRQREVSPVSAHKAQGPFRFKGQIYRASQKEVPGSLNEYQRGRMVAHKQLWGHREGIPAVMSNFIRAASRQPRIKR
jgi:hypothetical protein